jgi:hypothetical protein
MEVVTYDENQSTSSRKLQMSMIISLVVGSRCGVPANLWQYHKGLETFQVRFMFSPQSISAISFKAIFPGNSFQLKRGSWNVIKLPNTHSSG